MSENNLIIENNLTSEKKILYITNSINDYNFNIREIDEKEYLKIKSEDHHHEEFRYQCEYSAYDPSFKNNVEITQSKVYCLNTRMQKFGEKETSEQMKKRIEDFIEHIINGSRYMSLATLYLLDSNLKYITDFK